MRRSSVGRASLVQWVPTPGKVAGSSPAGATGVAGYGSGWPPGAVSTKRGMSASGRNSRVAWFFTNMHAPTRASHVPPAARPAGLIEGRHDE